MRKEKEKKREEKERGEKKKRKVKNSFFFLVAPPIPWIAECYYEISELRIPDDGELLSERMFTTDGIFQLFIVAHCNHDPTFRSVPVYGRFLRSSCQKLAVGWFRGVYFISSCMTLRNKRRGLIRKLR